VASVIQYAKCMSRVILSSAARLALYLTALFYKGRDIGEKYLT